MFYLFANVNIDSIILLNQTIMGTKVRPGGDQPGIHALPIVHKKYIMEAFARTSIKTGFPYVIVSIMKEDGTIVTGLKKDNFRVGYLFTDIDGVCYDGLIEDFQGVGSDSHSGDGIYRLVLGSKDFIGDLHKKIVFSVEAFDHEALDGNSMRYRGQTLAHLRS